MRRSIRGGEESGSLNSRTSTRRSPGRVQADEVGEVERAYRVSADCRKVVRVRTIAGSSPRGAGHGLIRFSAEALLLDLDGVLVDSARTVEEHWSRWAGRRGLEASSVLRLAHGSPARDVIARFVAPGEVARETAWIEGLALEPSDEVALPGALVALSQSYLPVAVVTSAPRLGARLRLERAGLPVPDVVVSGDDVQFGKPHPEPYQKGAAMLDAAPRFCVAVEDTPAGIESARSAGTTPFAVLTTHPLELLSGAVAVLQDLSCLLIDRNGLRYTAVDQDVPRDEESSNRGPPSWPLDGHSPA